MMKTHTYNGRERIRRRNDHWNLPLEKSLKNINTSNVLKMQSHYIKEKEECKVIGKENEVKRKS